MVLKAAGSELQPSRCAAHHLASRPAVARYSAPVLCPCRLAPRRRRHMTPTAGMRTLIAEYHRQQRCWTATPLLSCFSVSRKLFQKGLAKKRGHKASVLTAGAAVDVVEQANLCKVITYLLYQRLLCCRGSRRHRGTGRPVGARVHGATANYGSAWGIGRAGRSSRLRLR